MQPTHQESYPATRPALVLFLALGVALLPSGMLRAQSDDGDDFVPVTRRHARGSGAR